MHRDIPVKQVTTLYESCTKCGLPLINCICALCERTQTTTQFWILSSKREFHRPSNTARLMKLINPSSTEVFLWERTCEPEDLLQRISSGAFNVFLLFPAESDNLASRQTEYTQTDKIPAFILLDGTWKEARRILRKSSFLENLPIVSLDCNTPSKFNLRKGADSGQLCTIETAIEVLLQTGESEKAQVFERSFDLFLKCNKASVAGHAVKP